MMTDIQAVTVWAATNGIANSRAKPTAQAFGHPKSFGLRLLQMGIITSWMGAVHWIQPCKSNDVKDDKIWGARNQNMTAEGIPA